MNNIFDLTGNTALITGGGTGLGQQFARCMAGAGARVILTGRRLEKLNAAADHINNCSDYSGSAYAVAMDVTDRESIAAAFTEIGGYGHPTILVNNAGTVAKPLLLEISESDWDAVLDTNLKGAWLVANEFTRQLIQKNMSGSIINIASILGSSVQKGTGAYSASKAGLLQLTQCMALEWARYNIRVNAVAPGYFVTDLAEEFLKSSAGQKVVNAVPQRRLGGDGDLDGTILLLASNASRYMTGSLITVDGGLGIPALL